MSTVYIKFTIQSGAKIKLKQDRILGCPRPIPSYKLCLFGQTCLGMSFQRKFIFRAKLLLFWVASYTIQYIVPISASLHRALAG